MGGGREDDGIPAVQKTNANPPGFQTALFSPFPRRPARRVGTAERALVGFADASAPEPLGRARGAMAAAVAYHERDFDYDEHVAEVLATRPAPGSEARDAEPAPGDDASARTPEAQRSAWDRFHAAHARGAFFKPRRYLLAAFPALAAAPAGATSTVLELGCGSGSACVPVLAANPTARVLACDCAPEAVACAARRVAAAAEDAPGSFASRFAAFPCDPCVDDLAASVARAAESAGWWRSSSAPPGSGGDAFPVDAAMMIFVLSAVPPGAATARFLRAVRDALRPGARVFFRDYARYDLPMLRFRAGLLDASGGPGGGASRRREEESTTFARGDGTLATFRSKEEVVEMFENAGFEMAEGSEAVRYCCVRNTNRKKGVEMRRVFVHGEFVRPA